MQKNHWMKVMYRISSYLIYIIYFVTSYRMHALWYTYLKNRNLCLTLWHVHLIPLLVGHWDLRFLVTSTCVNLQEGIYGKMWVANAFLYTYVLSFLHFIALPKIKMLRFPEKVVPSQMASQKAQPIIGFYIWKLKCKMHLLEKIAYIYIIFVIRYFGRKRG